jgi:hypothetical protein
MQTTVTYSTDLKRKRERRDLGLAAILFTSNTARGSAQEAGATVYLDHGGGVWLAPRGSAAGSDTEGRRETGRQQAVITRMHSSLGVVDGICWRQMLCFGAPTSETMPNSEIGTW